MGRIQATTFDELERHRFAEAFRVFNGEQEREDPQTDQHTWSMLPLEGVVKLPDTSGEPVSGLVLMPTSYRYLRQHREHVLRFDMVQYSTQIRREIDTLSPLTGHLSVMRDGVGNLAVTVVTRFPQASYEDMITIDDLLSVLTAGGWADIFEEIATSIVNTVHGTRARRMRRTIQRILDAAIYQVRIPYLFRTTDKDNREVWAHNWWQMDASVMQHLRPFFQGREAQGRSRTALVEALFRSLVSNSSDLEQDRLERDSGFVFAPIAHFLTGQIRGVSSFHLKMIISVEQVRRLTRRSNISLLDDTLFAHPSIRYTVKPDTLHLWRGVFDEDTIPSADRLFRVMEEIERVGCRRDTTMVLKDTGGYVDGIRRVKLTRSLSQAVRWFYSPRYGNCLTMCLAPLFIRGRYEFLSDDVREYCRIRDYLSRAERMSITVRSSMEGTLYELEKKVWQWLLHMYAEFFERTVDTSTDSFFTRPHQLTYYLRTLDDTIGFESNVVIWRIAEERDMTGRVYHRLAPGNTSLLRYPNAAACNVLILNGHAYYMNVKPDRSGYEAFPPLKWRFCVRCKSEVLRGGENWIANHYCEPNYEGEKYVHRQRVRAGLYTNEREQNRRMRPQIIWRDDNRFYAIHDTGARKSEFSVTDKRLETHLQSTFAVDLETFIRPNTEGQMVVYAAGVCTVKSDDEDMAYHCFQGDALHPNRAIYQLLIYLIRYSKAHGKKIVVTSWNGSRFDWLPVLYGVLMLRAIRDREFPSVPHFSLVPGVIRKGNKIMRMVLKVEGGSTITFHDLCLILPMSLSAAAASLLGENDQKGDFEHGKVRSWTDVARYREEWYPYLEQDVVITARLYKELASVAYTLLDGMLLGYQISSSSMAFNCWKQVTAKEKPAAELPFLYAQLPSYNLECKFREAYIGGRVAPQAMYYCNEHVFSLASRQCQSPYNFLKGMSRASLKQLYRTVVSSGKQDYLRYIDVTSLYPAAMKLAKYPVGGYYSYSQETQDDIYEMNRLVAEMAQAESIQDIPLFICELWIEPNTNLLTPYLLKREKNGALSATLEPFLGTYCSADLWMAYRLGYRFRDVSCMWYWPRGEKLFDTYVDMAIKIKEQGSAEGNKAKRAFGKLLACGCYGKFAQKIIKEQWDIVSWDQLDFEKHLFYREIVDKDEEHVAYEVSWNEDEDEQVRYPVQIAIYVTAYSRVIMAQAMEVFNGFYDMRYMFYYTDTDSFIVTQDAYLKLALEGWMSGALGKFKDEYEGGIILEYVGLGKKTYKAIYLKEDGGLYEYTRAKGMPHCSEPIVLNRESRKICARHRNQGITLEEVVDIKKYAYTAEVKPLNSSIANKEIIYAEDNEMELSYIPFNWFAGRAKALLSQLYPSYRTALKYYNDVTKVECHFGTIKNLITPTVNLSCRITEHDADSSCFTLTKGIISRCLQQEGEGYWDLHHAERVLCMPHSECTIMSTPMHYLNSFMPHSLSELSDEAEPLLMSSGVYGSIEPVPLEQLY